MSTESNFADQVQQMMQAWTDAQKKVWDGWMATVAGTGGSAGNSEDWFARWQETATTSLDAWQEQARKALASQADWVRSDAFTAMMPGGSEQTKRLAASWAEQSTAMLAAWTDFQRRLLEGWFGLASAAGRPPGTDSAKEWFARWQDMATKSFEAWQDLARKAADAQAAWAREADGKTGGKSD